MFVLLGRYNMDPSGCLVMMAHTQTCSTDESLHSGARQRPVVTHGWKQNLQWRKAWSLSVSHKDANKLSHRDLQDSTRTDTAREFPQNVFYYCVTVWECAWWLMFHSDKRKSLDLILVARVTLAFLRNWRQEDWHSQTTRHFRKSTWRWRNTQRDVCVCVHVSENFSCH